MPGGRWAEALKIIHVRNYAYKREQFAPFYTIILVGKCMESSQNGMFCLHKLTLSFASASLFNKMHSH